MDAKKEALLSKAFLDLFEGYCEEHGCTLIGARVFSAEPDFADDTDAADA